MRAIRSLDAPRSALRPSQAKPAPPWPSFVTRQPCAFHRWELPFPSSSARLLREPLRHRREDVARGVFAEEQVDVAVVGGGAVRLGDQEPLLARRAERLLR